MVLESTFYDAQLGPVLAIADFLVVMVVGYGLPKLSMAQIKTFQVSSKAQHKFYKPLFFGKGALANWRKHVEPIANASR